MSGRVCVRKGIDAHASNVPKAIVSWLVDHRGLHSTHGIQVPTCLWAQTPDLRFVRLNGHSMSYHSRMYVTSKQGYSRMYTTVRCVDASIGWRSCTGHWTPVAPPRRGQQLRCVANTCNGKSARRQFSYGHRQLVSRQTFTTPKSYSRMCQPRVIAGEQCCGIIGGAEEKKITQVSGQAVVRASHIRTHPACTHNPVARHVVTILSSLVLHIVRYQLSASCARVDRSCQEGEGHNVKR